MFTGSTLPKILKFGIDVGYDLLYCVKENQFPPAYHFVISKNRFFDITK